MGVILKSLGGAGKGPPDLRHWLCTSAFLLGAGAGTPVSAAVSHGRSWWQPEGNRHLAQGHRGGGSVRAPGAAPLCACTLVPDLLPGACTRMQMHAHTPLHAQVLCRLLRCQQWAQLSRSISPTSSHAVGTFFFFFRCLVHWFSSQTPHGSGFVFAGLFSSPFPGIPPELEKGTMAAALPPAPGLFGVGWQPAGCWIKEPQRNTGG